MAAVDTERRVRQERDELIKNLVMQLMPCGDDIKQRMIEHLTRCDADYGRRVALGLGAVQQTEQDDVSPAFAGSAR